MVLQYYIIILWGHRRIYGSSLTETSLYGAWLYVGSTWLSLWTAIVFLTLIRLSSVMEAHHGFCVVGAGFCSPLEKSQTTKGYVSLSNTVPNAKHAWTHQLCVAQAGSATLAETLKSESRGRHYQLQRLTTRRYPLPLSGTYIRAFTIVLSIPQQREICVLAKSHVTENRVIRIRSDQKTSGTTFNLVFSQWSLKHAVKTQEISKIVSLYHK